MNQINLRRLMNYGRSTAKIGCLNLLLCSVLERIVKSKFKLWKYLKGFIGIGMELVVQQAEVHVGVVERVV